MGALLPARVHVRVTAQAVPVVLQDLFRNEVARNGARQGGEEVLHPLGVADLVPAARILGLQDQHQGREQAGHRGPAQADLPLDAPPGEAVQDEEPGARERRDHVHPVGDRALGRVRDHDHALDARQGPPRSPAGSGRSRTRRSPPAPRGGWAGRGRSGCGARRRARPVPRRAHPGPGAAGTCTGRTGSRRSGRSTIPRRG